ncbi:MAG: hypothetical protein MAG715_00686 [Methanonatronarchaeales archaeon]|nr:hypothetical protein [Methanonatronarchaeales archaeon]
MVRLRRDLLGGLVVVLPVLIVLYTVFWAFSMLSHLPLPFAPTGHPVIDAAIRVAVALAAFVIALLLAGRGTRTLVGRRAERWFDRQMNRIPAFRILYNASKVALEMAVRGAGEFQVPVRVHVSENISLVGFKTGSDIVEGRETVFVPTAPNITSGVVLYVEPDGIDEVEASTEDTLTHVISAGFMEPGEAESEEVETLIGYLQSDAEDAGGD